MSSWSKSGNSGRAQNYDMNQSQLNNLYNQNVASIQSFNRPIGSSGGSAGSSFPYHTGIVATMDSGEKYLVHKGEGFGSSGGNTVVVDAKNMTSKWVPSSESKATQNVGLGDLVAKGGKDYNIIFDNCINGRNRMMDQGKK